MTSLDTKKIANKDKYKHLWPEIIRLHALGWSDRSIQKKLGMANGTVASNRRRIGLPSNVSSPKKLEAGEDGLYECSKCFDRLTIDHFFLQRADARTGKPYYLSYCKSCKNKQAYNWRYSSIERYLSDTVQNTIRRANKNGIPVDITVDFMLDLADRQGHKCFYTDAKLEHKPSYKRNFGTNYSIDKIVPGLGYVKGNVVWCQQRINTIKSDVTLEEMSAWMPDWYERLQKRSNVYKF